MNVVPNKDLIEDAALELGITPAFVEKDWYVVQMLAIIKDIDLLGATAIFSGGTALGKAHKLLQRLSEDIDFRLVDPILETLSRSQQRRRLSTIKGRVSDAIAVQFKAGSMKLKAKDENRFFSMEVEYPTIFDRPQALRPHLLIEFAVASLSLPSLVKPVASFIADLGGSASEVSAIKCLDPVENAVDKLSAVVWRVPDRIREPKDDDPDLVRHIYDLSALYDRAVAHPDFKRLAIEMIAHDDSRCKKISGLSLVEKFRVLFATLENDSAYILEYTRFVQGMSYASKNVPTFKQALERLKDLQDYLSV
jgi:hypothetical protein